MIAAGIIGIVKVVLLISLCVLAASLGVMIWTIIKSRDIRNKE